MSFDLQNETLQMHHVKFNSCQLLMILWSLLSMRILHSSLWTIYWGKKCQVMASLNHCLVDTRAFRTEKRRIMQKIKPSTAVLLEAQMITLVPDLIWMQMTEGIWLPAMLLYHHAFLEALITWGDQPKAGWFSYLYLDAWAQVSVCYNKYLIFQYHMANYKVYTSSWFYVPSPLAFTPYQFFTIMNVCCLVLQVLS